LSLEYAFNEIIKPVTTIINHFISPAFFHKNYEDGLKAKISKDRTRIFMDEEVILVTVVSAWYTDLLISIFGEVYNVNYFLDNFFFNLRIVWPI
jgi:hypothetical protein